jgi:uncharacterized protein (TIGR03118 family)
MRFGLRPWRRWFGTQPRVRKPRGVRLSLESLEDRSVPSATGFVQTNLVSDIPGLAAVTDPQLINPWGLSSSPTSDLWVSDNQTGFSTLYDGQGTKAGLVVNIPNASGTFTHATPTGTVFNTDTNPNDFQVTDSGQTSSAFFLFDTLDGTIDGWNGASKNAVVAVPNTGANTGAIYTGLTMDTSTTAGNTLLYAADWGKGTVDVFNGGFQQVDQGAFQDKAIPTTFRPFNVQDINGDIFVTYAQFSPTTGADTGTGGFVAEFSRDGVLERTLTGQGHFNSPWGVALAPATFGNLGGDLLVGNFGDGHINAFDAHGHFVDAVKDPSGNPITVENLWALRFGNGGAAGSQNTLFFTAGLTDAPATIFGATDGLLGSLQPVAVVKGTPPIVPNLSPNIAQATSTVPSNGDLNPYGVAFVPQDFQGGGTLAPGDILVSNFNNSANVQGTGSTIVKISPNGVQSLFFQGPSGLGLTTALGILPQGFVLVGSLPTTQVSGQLVPQAGPILILDSSGNQVGQIPASAMLQGPWDLTINTVGNQSQVFVSNVLTGTVTRIDLVVPSGGTPQLLGETQIASGYMHRSDPNALVVGPTGLAFDPRTGKLYVASTGDNAIYAIANAATTTSDNGLGAVVVANSPHLHGPLGLALDPNNGDLIVTNGDAVNARQQHLNEIAEFTTRGKFVGQFQIDNGVGGAAFGLAVQDVNGQVQLATVDDNTNTLDVFNLLDT